MNQTVGVDILGGYEILGAVYADAATVALVQGAFGARPELAKDPVFTIFKNQKEIDGKISPKTKAAVKKFNTTYRGEPGDGENITDGTLAALKIKPLVAEQPKVVIREPGASEPLPFVDIDWSAKPYVPPEPDAPFGVVIRDPTGAPAAKVTTVYDRKLGVQKDVSLPTASTTGSFLDGVEPWKLALGAVGLGVAALGLWKLLSSRSE